jgi:hypothetical protein
VRLTRIPPLYNVPNEERPEPFSPGRSLVCDVAPYGWITKRSV